MSRHHLRLAVIAIVTVGLSACDSNDSDGNGTGTENTLTEFVVTIDDAVAPPVQSLPGFDDQTRPLSAIDTGTGDIAAFVSNEIWVADENRAAVDTLVARWNGEIIQELDMRAAGIDLPTQYLIRIDSTLADSSTIEASLRALEPEGGESLAISDQQGLGLLSVAAQESLNDISVGVNWVGQSNDLALGFTTEAPVGDSLASGVNYTPNANQWPTHNTGSTQDIGVTAAWEALARAGRLNNRIGLAVLDMGFTVTDDLSPDFEAASVVPTRSALDSENFVSCSGGNECPWHGTLVASAAMAVPDNSFGSAGPGGPVAKPVLINTTGDMFVSMAAIVRARLLGARIINMSYGVPVPWPLAFSVVPFESATTATRATGTLLFAAAGNSNSDVDKDETALGVSLGFEESWHTPCENQGVICVGGVGVNSLQKAANSSYGRKQVDIFAPFRLWLGPDPDNPANEARAKSGTSYSSPFAAGVAALIWSADPGMSADQVENLLLDTAHTSTDDKVNLVVNAAAAVQSALGNVAPNLDIRMPVENQELQVNLPYSFMADVEDFEEGRNCCVIDWSSDVDGELGSGQTLEVAFSTLGDRLITATTSDSQNATGTESIAVSVVNTTPLVRISSPAANTEIIEASQVTLRGSADDINEPDALLACDRLQWTSSVAADTDFPISGCEVTVAFPTIGSRTLSLTGTDPQGDSNSATVVISVIEAPVNLPPVVSITEPVDRQRVDTDETVSLTAVATDPENETNLSILWSVSVNGAPETDIGTGTPLNWRPIDSIDFSGEGRYEATIRVRASDSAGNTGSDQITLREWIVID